MRFRQALFSHYRCAELSGTQARACHMKQPSSLTTNLPSLLSAVELCRRVARYAAAIDVGRRLLYLLGKLGDTDGMRTGCGGYAGELRRRGLRCSGRGRGTCRLPGRSPSCQARLPHPHAHPHPRSDCMAGKYWLTFHTVCTERLLSAAGLVSRSFVCTASSFPAVTCAAEGKKARMEDCGQGF